MIETNSNQRSNQICGSVITHSIN